MKQPFNTLTKNDVQIIRKNRSCIPAGGNNVLYSYTLADIQMAHRHLKTLYPGNIALSFVERIILLNDIY